MAYIETELELDSETWEQLERLADEDGVTVEEFIQNIVKEYIDDYGEEIDDMLDDDDDFDDDEVDSYDDDEYDLED